MAIKGKKKARGAQAKRRPAQAPRPVLAARKPPWYKTTAGLSILSIGSLVALVVLIVLIVNLRAGARESAALKEGLEDYTGAIQALLQEVSPAASELMAAGTSQDAGVAEDAAGWATKMEDGQAMLAQAAPPPEVSTANTLYQQALVLYRSAAHAFELAGDADEDLSAELRTQALSQATTAEALWATANELLDEHRTEAGLNPSGLRTPGNDPSAAMPQEQPAGGSGNDGGGGGNG